MGTRCSPIRPARCANSASAPASATVSSSRCRRTTFSVDGLASAIEATRRVPRRSSAARTSAAANCSAGDGNAPELSAWGNEGASVGFMQFHRVAVLSLVLLAATPGLAQQPARNSDHHQPQPPDQKSAGSGVLRLLPAESVTEHSLDTAQGRLTYTATADTIPLYGQSGDQIAAIFYTSYVAKNGGAQRPLTFVFNGGPGAASAFLNLGLVGP